MSRNDSNSRGRNNGPTHNVYAIVGEGDSARWLEVGAAWLKSDSERGDTITIELDREPLAWRDGARRRLAVRERQSRGN